MNAPGPIAAATLDERFAATRALTRALAEPLSDADATVQPNPDASPAKWHLAHTTWFLETFVLRDHVPGYRAFDDRFAFLFNSYYDGEGDRHPRSRRGMISRPTLDQIRAWRRQVDDAVGHAFATLPADALALIELAIQHEQQHQELFLTDILATLSENPLEPAYLPTPSLRGGEADAAIHGQERTSATAHGLPRFARNDGWVSGAAGVIEIGAPADGFAFDCERPRHPTLLHPHAIAATCVTNADWQAFIDDGGYTSPALWLSEGWDWVRRESIAAPLYWRDDGSAFTLAGRKPIDPAAPVAHVSFYEAEAFARWAGARLPTEAEWEAFAAPADPAAGHQLDCAEAVAPRPGHPGPFGNVWQWTASAFLPFPGFAPAEGTVGEYNGKFMCGQFVLKGASCATPRGHSRASYRNFFPPSARWQFTGVRLARNA